MGEDQTTKRQTSPALGVLLGRWDLRGARLGEEEGGCPVGTLHFPILGVLGEIAVRRTSATSAMTKVGGLCNAQAALDDSLLGFDVQGIPDQEAGGH